MSISSILAALAAVSALVVAAPAWAQRPTGLDAPSGPTVAETGSRYYRFETASLTSADGLRRYRIRIAAPRRSAPATGWPAIYLLDGDAALAALDEDVLARLDGGDAPVLVAVGYDGDRRFHVENRAYDYTPASPGGGPVADHAGRPGGGADAFFDLIETQVKPLAAAAAPIDPARQTLWGHSYGGLFVLHAAFTRPAAFSRFAAASPSLWWNYGAVLDEETDFLAQALPAGLRLDLSAGEIEQRPRAPDARPRHPMWTSVPPGELARMAGRLREAGADVRYEIIPGQGHGGMLAASLHDLLRDFSGPARSGGVS